MSSAASSEGASTTASGRAYSARAALLRLITTLIRSASGRIFSGIDCHVLRPMMTALRLSGSAVERVSCLKYCMSPRRDQGSRPFAPIPRVCLHTATTTENLRRS